MVPDTTKKCPSIYLSLDVSQILNFIAFVTQTTPKNEVRYASLNRFQSRKFWYNSSNFFRERSKNFILYLIYLSIIEEVLLCYNTFWSLLASQFLPNTCFIFQIPSFILQYLCVVFHCSGNVHVWVPVFFLCSVAKDSVCALRNQDGEGKDDQVAKCFLRV